MPLIVDRLQADSQGVVTREGDLGGLKPGRSFWGNLSDLYFGRHLWIHQRRTTIRINYLSRDPLRLF